MAGERGHGHPFDPEIGDWLDAIRADRLPRTPLWDGANSTLAALTAARAQAAGQELEIPVYRPPQES